MGGSRASGSPDARKVVYSCDGKVGREGGIRSAQRETIKLRTDILGQSQVGYDRDVLGLN